VIPQYHGHDGVREWGKDLLVIFPDRRFDVLEMRDLGELMIAALRVRGRGVDSDAPFEETGLGGRGVARRPRGARPVGAAEAGLMRRRMGRGRATGSNRG
jgi:hypothetical protein